MFSTLGNIFSVKPRQAENADAHLGIRRHDPEFERKKHKKKTAAEDLFDQQDSATVSVEALRRFLQNFLKSLDTDREQNLQKKEAEAQAAIPETGQKPRREGRASGEASHAAGVYQTVAQASHRSSSILDSTDGAAQDLGLKAGEIRTIHALLTDLKILAEKKVEFLTIERAGTFLDSLVNAVSRAKK